MDGNNIDSDRATENADGLRDRMNAQHTNNLDGLLRDADDNIIKLNPRDFRHQCYLGEPVQNRASAGKPIRYVFRNGELVRVSPVADETLFSYI